MNYKNIIKEIRESSIVTKAILGLESVLLAADFVMLEPAVAAFYEFFHGNTPALEAKVLKADTAEVEPWRTTEVKLKVEYRLPQSVTPDSSKDIDDLEKIPDRVQAILNKGGYRHVIVTSFEEQPEFSKYKGKIYVFPVNLHISSTSRREGTAGCHSIISTQR